MKHVPDTSEEVEVEPGVYLAQLAAGEEMSIQHLRMDPGARVPEHDHHHEQIGFVYEGEQTFVLGEDDTITVGPGGSYSLRSNERHAAENRGDVTLRAIDIFSPPRTDPNWLE
jgi:quercetin dioxygenase-like cupin family protein